VVGSHVDTREKGNENKPYYQTRTLVAKGKKKEVGGKAIRGGYSTENSGLKLLKSLHSMRSQTQGKKTTEELGRGEDGFTPQKSELKRRKSGGGQRSGKNDRPARHEELGEPAN